MKDQIEKKTQKLEEVTLTPKQQKLLQEITQDKAQLNALANEISKREVIISSLILDSNGIEEDEVATAKLNEDGTVLLISRKNIS